MSRCSIVTTDCPPNRGFTGPTGPTGSGGTGPTGPGGTGPTGATGATGADSPFLLQFSGIAALISGTPAVNYFFDRGQASGETFADANVSPEGYPIPSITTISNLDLCVDDPSQLPDNGVYTFDVVTFAGGGNVPSVVPGASIAYTNASSRVQHVTFAPVAVPITDTIGLQGTQSGTVPDDNTSMLIMATVRATF